MMGRDSDEAPLVSIGHAGLRVEFRMTDDALRYSVGLTLSQIKGLREAYRVATGIDPAAMGHEAMVYELEMAMQRQFDKGRSHEREQQRTAKD